MTAETIKLIARATKGCNRRNVLHVGEYADGELVLQHGADDHSITGFYRPDGAEARVIFRADRAYTARQLEQEFAERAELYT